MRPDSTEQRSCPAARAAVAATATATATATAALVLVLAACGGSSSSSTSTSTTSTSTAQTTATASTGGVSAQSVEQAVRAQGGPPAPTTVHCHASSAAERAAAPFGHTALPLFTCELTVRGKRGRYAVQVLRNGCFVAERLGGGQSVQGCGVSRS